MQPPFEQNQTPTQPPSPARWFWDQFIRGRQPSPETANYRRLMWSTKQIANGSVDKNALKVFDVDGDHLTIFRVHGPAPVYVRLGPDENPFLPVYSRMVFSRPFRRVTFADGSLYSGGQLIVAGGGVSATESYELRVLAYASHGPLVAQFPPREYGMKRNPLVLSGLIATTATTDLMQLLIGTSLSTAGGFSLASTAGLEGATLYVLNTDPANDLYLCRTDGSSGNGGGYKFGPIRAGTAPLKLRLDDLLFKYTTDLDQCGFGFQTLAGTCTFSILLTRSEMNGAEGWQNNPSVAGIQ